MTASQNYAYISPEDYLEGINQERMSVEYFRRNSEGLWVLHPYSKGEEIHFAIVDFHCPIEALYEDVIGLVGAGLVRFGCNQKDNRQKSPDIKPALLRWLKEEKKMP